MSNIQIYIQLIIYAMVPVLASVCFFLLQKKTRFGQLPYKTQQIIIGIVFGLVACFGTRFGVDVGGATANARDAGPLCAGLLFGGPAGIIAGLIGGIHRWFAVYWGAGMYSRWACSVSTVLAGVVAALFRKYMLDDERPGAFWGLMIAMVMEIIHLTLLFFTHLTDPGEAFRIVMIVTLPMVLANVAGVFLSAVLLNLFSGEIRKKIRRDSKAIVSITTLVQKSVLIVIAVAYLFTTVFVYVLQTSTSFFDTESLLSTNILDVEDSINASADKAALEIARNAMMKLSSSGFKADLNAMSKDYEVTDVHIIDKKGIITRSSNKMYEGFDMNSGEQSAEFLCINRGECESYVQDFSNISFDDENADLARKFAAWKLPTGGFVQIGLDLEQFQKMFSNQIYEITLNRRIGKNGYFLICNNVGKVLSDKPEQSSESINETGLSVKELANENVFRQTVYGENSFCMAKRTEGFYIIGIIPETEVFETRNINVYINSFMEILTFAALFVILYLLLKSLIVNDIKKVNSSLISITNGNLDEVLDIRTSQELSNLSDRINETVDTLKGYIAEAEDRMKKDLELAKNIQASSLPSVFPPYPSIREFDIYATMDPAREVGGDFYDFYMIGRHSLAITIADVSGKGIPAAMFMMRSKATIKNLVERREPVDVVFTKVNEMLCEGNEAGMFVTAWLGILDTDTGHLDYACAGHNPPVVYRKGEGYSYLKQRPGFVLAGMEGVTYKLQETELRPGDKIYLYTDGITEATSDTTELYGEQRLLDYLNAHSEDSVEETLKGVKEDIDRFVGTAEQFDDMTMLCVKFNKKTEEE